MVQAKTVHRSAATYSVTQHERDTILLFSKSMLYQGSGIYFLLNLSLFANSHIGE